MDGALTDTRTMIPYDNTTSPDLHLTTTLDFICPLDKTTRQFLPLSAPMILTHRRTWVWILPPRAAHRSRLRRAAL